MATELISYARHFQIWIYTVSHSQLLLRSNRSNERPTRVDILFKNVGHLDLPTVFDSLAITELSDAEIRETHAKLDPVIRLHRKVFAVRGSGFSGLVVAGAVSWHEDEGYHYDESYFQTSFLQRV